LEVVVGSETRPVLIPIDVRTVYINLCITNALCVLVMLFLYIQNSGRYKGPRYWLMGAGLQLLGGLLIVLRGVTPAFISIVVGNACILAGIFLFYRGLEEYIGKTGPWWPGIILLAVFVLIHTYFGVIQPSLQARNITFALFMGIFFIQSAWLTLRRAYEPVRQGSFWAGLSLSGLSLVCVAYIIANLVLPPGNDLFKSGPITGIFILVFQVLITGLTFGLVLMVNSRLSFELNQDIARRLRAEKIMLDISRKNEDAMSVAKMATWEFDVPTSTFTFNQRFYQLHGITDAPGFSMSAAEFTQNYTHPDYVQQILDVIQKAINAKTNDFYLEVEGQLLRSNGEAFWVNTWFRAEKDDAGRTIKLHGVNQDITERVNMQKVLIDSERLAGIGTLAAGVAHEINTPLQIITGTSETIQKKLQDGQNISMDEVKRRCENINQNAWRIAGIVRSLLEYSRSSSEQSTTCSLNEIVQNTLLLTEHQFKSWSNISILNELAPDLPPVICDSKKVTQVLVNLLVNARDSMPDGGQIRIETGFDASSRQVFIRVRDGGPGIPVEIQGKIFDPFFTTKPIGKGSGLGLSISAGILRAHGGKLELESSSPQGSVFKASLPLEEQH
jgi:signal transduction histidine kinase